MVAGALLAPSPGQEGARSNRLRTDDEEINMGLRLRDVPFQFVKPGQLLEARRLHKNNPAARAELDALNEQSGTDQVPDNAAYLAREAEIIARYR